MHVWNLFYSIMLRKFRAFDRFEKRTHPCASNHYTCFGGKLQGRVSSWLCEWLRQSWVMGIPAFSVGFSANSVKWTANIFWGISLIFFFPFRTYFVFYTNEILHVFNNYCSHDTNSNKSPSMSSGQNERMSWAPQKDLSISGDVIVCINKKTHIYLHFHFIHFLPYAIWLHTVLHIFSEHQCISPFMNRTAQI